MGLIWARWNQSVPLHYISLTISLQYLPIYCQTYVSKVVLSFQVFQLKYFIHFNFPYACYIPGPFHPPSLHYLVKRSLLWRNLFMERLFLYLLVSAYIDFCVFVLLFQESAGIGVVRHTGRTGRLISVYRGLLSLMLSHICTSHFYVWDNSCHGTVL
jgi:hypothetical protein